jgi:hypothetical protein
MGGGDGKIIFINIPVKIIYCIMKDEKWYADEVSDTTMMTIAASLLGQKNNLSTA